jgi:hypothetical protein
VIQIPDLRWCEGEGEEHLIIVILCRSHSYKVNGAKTTPVHDQSGLKCNLNSGIIFLCDEELEFICQKLKQQER